MKKIFFFAILAIAMAAFGMRTGIVHAQTTAAASTNTATLQQQLDVAKATLLNLEMQAGMVPQGDDQLGGGSVLGTATTTVPQTGLSATQVSYFNGVLAQLATALSQLNTLVANPNLSQVQISAIASTLGAMQGTVSTMATQIAQDENGGAPIAMTNPSSQTTAPAAGTVTTGTQTQGNGAGVAANPATAPVAAVTATSTTPVQATAQASSFWSFTKTNWPVIVIIVLVIAILAILFWPENEAKAPVTTATTVSTTKTTVTMPSGPAKPMAAGTNVQHNA